MSYLLYSSNEMFSSTQLVRKSKEIFDKLSKNEIAKAVILRDGKPNFMLLDFFKYEQIMKEFEQLKDYYENNKNIKISKKENINKIIKQNKIVEIDNIQKKQILNDEDKLKKQNEEKELLKALKQLESLNLDPQLKAQTQKKLEDEHKSGEIKEFWN